MITVDGGELAELRELQARALEAVAWGWAQRPEPVGRPVPGRSTLLREVAEVTGLLAVAARQTATAAAQAGWPRAVEVADAISTTAQALRMLAELELTASPGA